MIDPLALSTGVAGLASLAIQVVQVTSTYVSRVANAQDQVLDALNTVTSLAAVLTRIKDALDKVKTHGIVGAPPQDLSEDTIKACTRPLLKLKTTLERGLNESGSLKLHRALTWPLNKKDATEDLICQIDRYKGTFHAMLTIDSM